MSQSAQQIANLSKFAAENRLATSSRIFGEFATALLKVSYWKKTRSEDFSPDL